MDEGGFFFWGTIAFFLLLAFTASVVGYATIQWQPHEYALRQQCIADGGIWMDGAHDALCVWSKRAAAAN